MRVILALASCVAAPPDGTDTATMDSEPTPVATGDTGGAAPQRPVEWRGGNLYTRLGHATSFVDADDQGPLLAMSTPGCCSWEDQSLDVVRLVDPLLQQEGAGGGSPGVAGFRADAQAPGVNTFLEFEFGSEILPAGDVTGDGLDDLVVFDTSDFLGHGGWLFHSPLLDPAERSTDECQSPISGVPWRGAACGDVDGDGHTDLCTAAGVALGPLDGPIDTWHTTWTGTAPSSDVHVASAAEVADGVAGLLISDPTAEAVYRLTTFSAGDVDLATEASATWSAPAAPTALAVGGDLDGDGAGDLVVAWADGVAVSTTLGGDLTTAHATWAGEARSLAIADLDGDGQDDLIVGGIGEVLLFLGPLPSGELTRSDATNILTGYEFPVDEFGFAVAAADVDGNGDAELAVAAPAARYLPDWPTFPGGRVFLFHDPATFSWDAFDPPLEPIWGPWVTEEE